MISPYIPQRTFDSLLNYGELSKLPKLASILETSGTITQYTQHSLKVDQGIQNSTKTTKLIRNAVGSSLPAS